MAGRGTRDRDDGIVFEALFVLRSYGRIYRFDVDGNESKHQRQTRADKGEKGQTASGWTVGPENFWQGHVNCTKKTSPGEK